jgi:hypothetical protein
VLGVGDVWGVPGLDWALPGGAKLQRAQLVVRELEARTVSLGSEGKRP